MANQSKSDKKIELYFGAKAVAEENDAVYKLAEMHRQEWELASHDFWYFCNYVQTVDEELKQIRPFPTNFDYLLDVDHQIETHQKTIILKPRRHMISWLGVLRNLHEAIFSGSEVTGSHGAFRGGIATVGEVEALYMIERISKVWHRLPFWIQDRNPLDVDNKMMLKFRNGGTIQAFPMKKEGPQSFGFSRFFFDEMAIQDAARSTWTGMIPTLGKLGKLLAVSTPNGKLNFFYEVWDNKDNRFGDIHRVNLCVGAGYQAHPEHDDKWFASATAGMDKQMVARMFLGSFAPYAGKPVWQEFDTKMHTADTTEVIAGKTMLWGWDFGYQRPAIIFAQYSNRDQYIVHKEFRAYDCGFDNFVKDAKTFANSFYDFRGTPAIHFVDPSGFSRYHSKARSGAMSDVAEIKLQLGAGTQIRTGSLDTGTASIEGPRLKEVRKLWGMRSDGNSWIVISRQGCPTFVEGCQGAYCYPETGGERPWKNEASDIQDAFQYLVTGYNRMARPQEASAGVRGSTQKHIGYKTGI